MRKTLIPYLRCTAGCDSELQLFPNTPVDNESIESGYLQCSCGRKYSIEYGIVRMLPAELEASSESNACDESVLRKHSEIKARDAQVEDYDRMWYLTLFGKIEIPFTLRRLNLHPDSILLEGGCGTGRMTKEFAARCGRLISIDFSWESLRSNALKLRSAGVTNVDLIQADLCNLPLKSEVFDRVVSCQVLEHIPSMECRGSAVSELNRVMRQDGRLVISAYRHSLLTRCFGEKEGEHDGGIYFFRFAREELHDLLSQHLKVNEINGAMVYHFTASCRKIE